MESIEYSNYFHHLFSNI